jgi:hypothetical protein
MHGHPFPLGYARVSIDRILDKKYNKIHTDYLTKEDRPHLDQKQGDYCDLAQTLHKVC